MLEAQIANSMGTTERSMTNPFEAFIDSRTNIRNFKRQFAIVFLAGIAFAMDVLGPYTLLLGTEAESTYGPMFIVLGFVYLLVPFIFWLVLSLVTFIIARYLGARAEYGTITRIMGWGMIPLIGATASFAAGRYLAMSSRWSNVCDYPPIDCSFATFVTIPNQVDHVYGLLGTVTAEPVFLGLFALAAVFYLISAYFVSVAADTASTLTRTGGYVAAGLPMLVFGVLFTYSVFA